MAAKYLEKMNIIAIIPARGGSKGIPRKNVRLLNGRPLIAYSIIEAKKSRFVNHVVVSTEDDEIAGLAREWGAEIPCMRPHELAKDDVPTLPVIQHMTLCAEKSFGAVDIVVLLQPTSPLRTVKDIDAAIGKLIDTRADSVVSVVEMKHHPYLSFNLDGDRLEPLYGVEKRVQRQKLPPTYALNGAVYVTRRDVLINSGIYGEDNRAIVMPEERSIDIDDMFQFRLVEMIMRGTGC